MKILNTPLFISTISLLFSILPSQGSLLSGGFLSLKNDSSLPIKIELKTTLDATYYSAEEKASSPSTYEFNKTIDLNAGQTLPTEINIPNSHPISISLEINNKKVLDNYTIPENGFSHSGSESVTLPNKDSDPQNPSHYIKAKLWWSRFSPNEKQLQPVPVPLHIKAHYANSHYFWW